MIIQLFQKIEKFRKIRRIGFFLISFLEARFRYTGYFTSIIYEQDYYDIFE